MKLLITGACGFLGSAVCEALTERVAGVKIIGLDNLCRRGSETNVSRLKKMGVHFIKGDIRSEKDLSRMPAVDFVIDCAANPSVLGGVEGADAAREVVGHNLTGTLNLLDYCAKSKAGFVLISTSRIYSIEALNNLPLKVKGSRFVIASGALPAIWQAGKQSQNRDCFAGLSASLQRTRPVPGGRPSRNDGSVKGFSPRGINENMSTDGPLSLYGATKRASEVMAIEYGNLQGFPVWINRCSVLGGAGQFGKMEQGLVSYWISTYLLDTPLTYFSFGGKGLQLRDVLHPRDLAALIMKQMKEPLHTKKPRIYNVGGGMSRSASLAELSAWCDKRLGRKKKIRSAASRTFDIPYYVSDTSLAKKEFGWSPKISLETILDESWGWGDRNIKLLRRLSDGG